MIRLIYILFFISSASFGQSLIDLQAQAQAQSGGVENPNPELYVKGNRIATAAYEANVDNVDIYTERTTFVTSGLPATQDGSSYLMAWQHDTGSGSDSYISVHSIPVTNGQTYEISYWAWDDGTAGLYDSSGTGLDSFPNHTYTSTPTQYTHTATANASTFNLVFRAGLSGVAYVHSLSVKVAN